MKALFQLRAETMPSMLLVKDAADRRYVMINKAGEELLGVSRAGMLGKTDYELYPKDEADAFTECDTEVLASDEVMTIDEELVPTELLSAAQDAHHNIRGRSAQPRSDSLTG